MAACSRYVSNTQVVDASVDLDDVHDAFELVGITMAGFAVT